MIKTTSGVWVCPNPHVAFMYTQHPLVIEAAKQLDCASLHMMKNTTRITFTNIDPLLATILHSYLRSFENAISS